MNFPKEQLIGKEKLIHSSQNELNDVNFPYSFIQADMKQICIP